MQEPAAGNASASINPATGVPFAWWTWADNSRIDTAIEAASRAAGSWRHCPPAQRAALLHSIAAGLRTHKAVLARTITLEMGKPLVEAEAEVEKSAWNCDYVAEHGPAWLADEQVATQARRSYVSHLPLGVVLTILPWNFPVWQVFRCAAGALMAGNSLLLKHAPNVQGCAQLITKIIASAGAPAGLFQNLHAPVEAVAGIIADRRVAAVTLTGSPAAGAKVAAQAGAACKKSVLELGGSDAFIVLADADLPAAVAAAVRARFTNCGQVCLAAKRFILDKRIADEFSTLFSAAATALRSGDPLEAATQIGPMARADLREQIEAQVAASVHAGARVLAGARRSESPGWFYPPTVLDSVTPDMPVVAQETFGPVAVLQVARDTDEAVAMTNASDFGLSTMLWTADLDRARDLARRFEVGGVFVNSVTASDPRLPVGGVKLSGYGRELGRTGMLELCNLQTVWMA
jgi:succinate-semialdehyde dehydrogenase / glutarate-semialdehyde dehydrogenase